ncbi:MAG TPA: hypothetical protein VF487_07125 [Chitinophagaceae bacterium]
MIRRTGFWLFTFLGWSLAAFAQRPERDYKQFYPIGDDPDILYKTSYIKSETILFEANPIARYSFHNNIHKNLLNATKKKASAFYVAFEPQLRMYTDNSLPVKMPSYRVQLGFQGLHRVNGNDFFSYAVESGHYSNGQPGCAFSELYDDGSSQCEAMYDLITPDSDLSALLNRKDGNFSTNLTEIIFNYRFNHIDENFERPDRIHSLTLGFNIFHDRFWGIFDFGGYSDNDIKIYGRMRYSLGYSYIRLIKPTRSNPTRIAFAENIELISGAHPWVNSLRSVTTITYYPVGKFKEFGICASYIYGHDNYNFRFVDSGSQLALGLTWSSFPSFQIQLKE